MHQVKIAAWESKSDLPKKILKKLGNRDYILTNLEIVKESIDARDKNDIKLDVYKRQPYRFPDRFAFQRFPGPYPFPA